MSVQYSDCNRFRVSRDRAGGLSKLAFRSFTTLSLIDLGTRSFTIFRIGFLLDNKLWTKGFLGIPEITLTNLDDTIENHTINPYQHLAQRLEVADLEKLVK